MYEVKSSEYFTHVRSDIVAALGGMRFSKVLELGAGGCDTLLFMKKNGLADEVTGVELFEIENSNQKDLNLDKLFIAGIEKIRDLPLQQNYFDLVICGDVLEHVFDPWKVLEDVKFTMKPNATLICSIPNFRDIQTMKKIFFEGNFEYNPEGGILDRTHMRFFCKKNIVSLFTKTGFAIDKIEPSFKYTTTQKRRKFLNKMTLGIFEEFLAFQYIVTVKPILN